ncbi:MAG: DUF4426 domain-containing protein [Pseudomonadota bacterium]|nr:DUF4426 domain-containing protein [Pseudomonadota bacterium]
MRSKLLQRLASAAVLSAALPLAWGQAHVAESGVHTMRASVTPSAALATETARAHGIDVAADRGVVNVVVLERGDAGQRPVPAEVSATRTDLAGRPETIEMREIRANGGISYLGTFTVLTSPTARFRISARPAKAGQPLTVEFEERFPLAR